MESIFALDIGTRVVIGLLMEKSERGYEILASARTEHQQRAMYDGQVHDVDEVARAVQRVKEELEKKTAQPLHQVAVAAAGRALKTEIASAERREVQPIRWEREDVLALEMEAVQQALRQAGFGGEGWVTHHCVGYDTISQKIEGEEIGNLIGQRGRAAQVTIIATFLPRTVVDGLMAVLDRVGLQMQSLTLEPIAAGQAAIPLNMRRLNLALVDVGAGTADIALTRDGSFFAYGMVPMAGDEVTEEICAKYLLDFQSGEKLKRELNNKKSHVTFMDFFGTKMKLSREEVLAVIEDIVSRLAEKIAAEIISLNRDVPQAVILIGGGSLTPMLQDKMSEKIGIPQARVGIQVRERLANIYGEKSNKGPEWITPIGIGLAALEQKGLHYYSVSVNEHIIPIFELQLATAAEALLAAGIQPRAFLGRPGAALTYELNGKIQVIKGELGQTAQLLINGQPGRLEQTLQAGDIVRFTPGISGKDAAAFVKDILPKVKNKSIVWNGLPKSFCPRVLIAGQEVKADKPIKDGAKITFQANEDLQDLLAQKGLSLLEKRRLNLRINGQSRQVEVLAGVYVNGRQVFENCPITDGDKIEYKEEKVQLGGLDLIGNAQAYYVNGQAISYKPNNLTVFCHGEKLKKDSILSDGMDLRVESIMPILSDILPQVPIPKDIPAGARLILTVNNRPAEFTTTLHPGDRISVVWE